jgi:endonuclease YncB( thermonuclease family)
MRHLWIPSFLLILWSSLAHAGPLTRYPAQCLRVIDGDTVEILVELRRGLYERITGRLLGVDTPEVRSRDPKEKKAAADASLFVAERLRCPWRYGEKVEPRVDLSEWPVQVSQHGRGARGRVLVNLYVNGVQLNAELLKKGYAKEYGK